MSDSSTARKVQHRYDVKYSTALMWVRDLSNRDQAGKSRRDGQSFSERLVEVIAERHNLKEA